MNVNSAVARRGVLVLAFIPFIIIISLVVNFLLLSVAHSSSSNNAPVQRHISNHSSFLLHSWWSPYSTSANIDPLLLEVEDEAITSLDGFVDDDDDYSEPDPCELSPFEKRNPEPFDEAGCPNTPFRFLAAGEERGIVRLASFPGSGNTWARHLIERGLGIVTGSVYNDVYLQQEFLGERCTNGSRVIAVKTHDPWCPLFNRVAQLRQQRKYYFPANATILLLRNPKALFLSFFHHVYSGFNHTGHAPAQFFRTQRFETFVTSYTPCWIAHTRHYLANKTSEDGQWLDVMGQPVLLVYYEELRRNTEFELERIFKFLRQFHGAIAAAAAGSRELDAASAARCAVNGDAAARRGSFQRKKREDVVDPWQVRASSSASLRGMRNLSEYICSFAVNEPYYKLGDEEWCFYNDSHTHQLYGKMIREQTGKLW